MKNICLFLLVFVVRIPAWSQQSVVINTDPRNMESGSGFFHSVKVSYRLDPEKRAYLIRLESSTIRPDRGYYYRGGIYPAKMYSCGELSGACGKGASGFVTVTLHIRYKNETLPVSEAMEVGESRYFYPKNVPGDDIVGQTTVVKSEVTHIDYGDVGGAAESAILALEDKKRLNKDVSVSSTSSTGSQNSTSSGSTSSGSSSGKTASSASSSQANTQSGAYNDAMASVRAAQAQAAYNEARNEQLAQEFTQFSAETYTWISGMVAEGRARRARKYNDARDGIEERIARQQLYERAEKGDVNALKRIGDAYYAGSSERGGLKHYQDLLDVAVSWWTKAANLGDVDAMETLAVNSSIFVAKDKARAKEWTAKWVAAMEDMIGKKNSRVAYYKLSQLYLNLGRYSFLKWPEDPDKGKQYLAKAVEMKYLPAMDDVVEYYERGTYGYPKDSAKAYQALLEMVTISEGLRHWSILLEDYYKQLADYHEKGRGGQQKDAAMAAYWRKHAETASNTYVIPNRGPNTTGFQQGIYLETGGKPGESYKLTIEGFYLKYEIIHQKQFAKFTATGSDCWFFEPANQPGIRYLLKLTSPTTADLWKGPDKIATFTRQEG